MDINLQKAMGLVNSDRGNSDEAELEAQAKLDAQAEEMKENSRQAIFEMREAGVSEDKIAKTIKIAREFTPQDFQDYHEMSIRNNTILAIGVQALAMKTLGAQGVVLADPVMRMLSYGKLMGMSEEEKHVALNEMKKERASDIADHSYSKASKEELQKYAEESSDYKQERWDELMTTDNPTEEELAEIDNLRSDRAGLAIKGYAEEAVKDDLFDEIFETVDTFLERMYLTSSLTSNASLSNSPSTKERLIYEKNKALGKVEGTMENQITQPENISDPIADDINYSDETVDNENMDNLNIENPRSTVFAGTAGGVIMGMVGTGGALKTAKNLTGMALGTTKIAGLINSASRPIKYLQTALKPFIATTKTGKVISNVGTGVSKASKVYSSCSPVWATDFAVYEGWNKFNEKYGDVDEAKVGNAIALGVAAGAVSHVTNTVLYGAVSQALGKAFLGTSIIGKTVQYTKLGQNVKGLGLLSKGKSALQWAKLLSKGKSALQWAKNAPVNTVKGAPWTLAQGTTGGALGAIENSVYQGYELAVGDRDGFSWNELALSSTIMAGFSMLGFNNEEFFAHEKKNFLKNMERMNYVFPDGKTGLYEGIKRASSPNEIKKAMGDVQAFHFCAGSLDRAITYMSMMDPLGKSEIAITQSMDVPTLKGAVPDDFKTVQAKGKSTKKGKFINSYNKESDYMSSQTLQYNFMYDRWKTLVSDNYKETGIIDPKFMYRSLYEIQRDLNTRIQRSIDYFKQQYKGGDVNQAEYFQMAKDFQMFSVSGHNKPNTAYANLGLVMEQSLSQKESAIFSRNPKYHIDVQDGRLVSKLDNVGKPNVEYSGDLKDAVVDDDSMIHSTAKDDGGFRTRSASEVDTLQQGIIIKDQEIIKEQLRFFEGIGFDDSFNKGADLYGREADAYFNSIGVAYPRKLAGFVQADDPMLYSLTKRNEVELDFLLGDATPRTKEPFEDAKAFILMNEEIWRLMDNKFENDNAFILSREVRKEIENTVYKNAMKNADRRIDGVKQAKKVDVELRKTNKKLEDIRIELERIQLEKEIAGMSPLEQIEYKNKILLDEEVAKERLRLFGDDVGALEYRLNKMVDRPEIILNKMGEVTESPDRSESAKEMLKMFEDFKDIDGGF